MRAFDYNSFADLSQVFDYRKGQVVKPQPLVSAQFRVEARDITAPQMARVMLFSTTSLKAQLAQSRFVSLGTLLPSVTPRFVTASARKIKPVVIEIAPAVVEPVVTVLATVAPVAAVAAPKARSILKLKTKVELPILQPLSRNSTTQDLAAAFRAEKALMEKKTAVAQHQQPMGSGGWLEDAFAKRRRHPLSDKPWSELLAEVEAPKQSKNSFDLGAAFKAEMKAFMAEQEKLGNAPAKPQFKVAAEQQNNQPSAPRRQSLAA